MNLGNNLLENITQTDSYTGSRTHTDTHTHRKEDGKYNITNTTYRESPILAGIRIPTCTNLSDKHLRPQTCADFAHKHIGPHRNIRPIGGFLWASYGSFLTMDILASRIGQKFSTDICRTTFSPRNPDRSGQFLPSFSAIPSSFSSFSITLSLWDVANGIYTFLW